MIGQIEQEMVTALQEASLDNRLGYQIEKIAIYKGMKEKSAAEAASSQTSVLVSFDNKKLVKEFAYSRQYEATFCLKVLTKTPEGIDSTEIPALTAVDVCRMAEDVENLFHGNNLGMLCSSLKLEAMTSFTGELLEQNHLEAMELFFTGIFETTLNYSDVQNPFETLNTNWTLQDFESSTTIKLQQPQEHSPNAE